MLLNLIFQGHIALFALIILALVLSLSFHEFGHAAMARWYGDDTAARAGRLTLNPMAHLDPMGLLMVVMVGFGYAKPVPTNPRNYTSSWGDFFVSSAGPGMNLVVAAVAINAYDLALHSGWAWAASPGPQFFFTFLARINLILMVFNLIPLGALDGHYILPYFLSRRWAALYRRYNDHYGNMALMALVLLAIVGIPIFSFVWHFSGALLPLIRIA